MRSSEIDINAVSERTRKERIVGEKKGCNCKWCRDYNKKVINGMK